MKSSQNREVPSADHQLLGRRMRRFVLTGCIAFNVSWSFVVMASNTESSTRSRAQEEWEALQALGTELSGPNWSLSFASNIELIVVGRVTNATVDLIKNTRHVSMAVQVTTKVIGNCENQLTVVWDEVESPSVDLDRLTKGNEVVILCKRRSEQQERGARQKGDWILPQGVQALRFIEEGRRTEQLEILKQYMTWIMRADSDEYAFLKWLSGLVSDTNGLYSQAAFYDGKNSLLSKWSTEPTEYRKRKAFCKTIAEDVAMAEELRLYAAFMAFRHANRREIAAVIKDYNWPIRIQSLLKVLEELAPE